MQVSGDGRGVLKFELDVRPGFFSAINHLRKGLLPLTIAAEIQHSNFLGGQWHVMEKVKYFVECAQEDRSLMG